MAKTINIPIDEWYKKSKDWLVDFFKNIDKIESIGVGLITVGIILLITGLVLL